MTPPEAGGKLEKLRIVAYLDKEMDTFHDEYEVQFNPASYQISAGIEVDKKLQGKGTSATQPVYRLTPPRAFSVSFTIDGTGAAAEETDVEAEVRSFLHVVEGYVGDTHSPPYLILAWGPLVLRAIFDKATFRYTLFDRHGDPLRVVVTASFTQYETDERRVARARTSSPDLTHQHVVTQGDSLNLIAHRTYGDLAHAVDLARHNGLDDLWSLTPGASLALPPLAEEERP